MSNPIGDADKLIQRWADAKKIEVEQAIRAAALDLKTRVVEQTPVDTGRLRGAWMLEQVDSETMRLLNNVEYAEAVEYGLGKGARTPALMLNNSVLEWVRDIEADIKRQVD